MTRQDMQNVVEYAKNRIIERLVTKYDVQAACDQAVKRAFSSIQELHQENQIMLRQTTAQRDQLWRKAIAIEGRLSLIEQELRGLHQLMQRAMGDQQRNQRILAFRR